MTPDAAVATSRFGVGPALLQHRKRVRKSAEIRLISCLSLLLHLRRLPRVAG
jgi:hypothetical protein